LTPALPRGIDKFAKAFGVDPGSLKRFRSKGSGSSVVLMVLCRNKTPDILWCLRCNHKEPLIPEDWDGECEAGPERMEKHLLKSHNSRPDYYATSPDETEKTLAYITKIRLWREERQNTAPDE